jgi:hypothetical protein
MYKGEAHGDFELRTTLEDSKRLNSTFAISSFSGSRRQDFAKTGDDCEQFWISAV